MTVQYDADSVYKNTEIVDNKYLDVMESVISDISVYDLYSLTLLAKYNERPDVLAYDLFSNSNSSNIPI